MNYCPKCGNAITDGDLYCSKCGLKVFSNSSTPDINSTKYNVGGLRYPKTIIATFVTYLAQQILNLIPWNPPVVMANAWHIITVFFHLATFAFLIDEYERNNKIITTSTLILLLINILLLVLSVYFLFLPIIRSFN